MVSSINTVPHKEVFLSEPIQSVSRGVNTYEINYFHIVERLKKVHKEIKKLKQSLNTLYDIEI